MSSESDRPAPQRDIYSVSRLNSEVRSVLEGSFPLLWVEGEISNLARPASGHIYFSLKDPQAQVRCAMFRMKRQRLRFEPENGSKVLIRARVGLYEGRGEFQLVVEHMEPAGEGALRQAFEALKAKLNAEGLFDTAHKRPLPRLPRRIGIITSPSGAAVRDVISVLGRRFPAIPILIYPTAVQGDGAAGEILSALQLAEQQNCCDLLILTRGGGSLEDLMAFNDEALARAIHQCKIPLISAVGHEIDFTISDFVADRRAPTPSAAAEMASPDRDELRLQLMHLRQRLKQRTLQGLQHRSGLLERLEQQLNQHHPARTIEQQGQTLDRAEIALVRALAGTTRQLDSRLATLRLRLHSLSPARQLAQRTLQLEGLSRRLRQLLQQQLDQKRQALALGAGRLNAYSPLATLERGYSITLDSKTGQVIHSTADTDNGREIETRLFRGRLRSRVTELLPEE